MKNIFLALMSFVTTVHSAHAADSELAQDLIDNLTNMKAVYKAGYAPASWKKQFAGYDLNVTYADAVEKAKSKSSLTEHDTRVILKDFVYAMKDYHVSISFSSTEEASLPFTVKSVGDRFFIVYINRDKLTEEAFPFQVGDELMTVDGVPTVDVVKAIQSQIIENVPLTDRALAEGYLTRRTGLKGFVVPQGPVNLEIKPQGADSIKSVQLMWDYVPEAVQPRKQMLMSALSTPAAPLKSAKSSLLRKPMMSVDTSEDMFAPENPFLRGAKKSFTPALGAKVWESAKDDLFDAYIYLSPERKLVGYVRIASYVMEDDVKAVEEFASIIARFEKTTDAMVIDQVSNPGGSVFYLYALASMLSDKPLTTPLHRMTITQADVLDAYKLIEQLKNIKTDEEAKKALPLSETGGYPATYQFVQFCLSYAKFTIDEWNQGRTLSNPYWLYGVNHINPAPTHYTKPILLLTNMLDFSGGDFFPAILQDNKRATIMGTRTAGAGGYVHDVNVPNNLGIASFRITGSIAERVNKNPIENLGVIPDISYDMTVEDYTNNFAPYVSAIHSNVKALIK